jgi:hypothetical protein
MPPMTRADAVAYAGPMKPGFEPVRHPPAERPIPVLEEYDPALDISRWSVTTHPGKYFLWIRRPRLTFYFEAPGREVAAPPATVEFVFRTQSPQDIVDNHLVFTCDGSSRPSATVPAFSEQQSISTVTQYLLYRMPLDEFVPLARCTSLSAAVGPIAADFSPTQVTALRELARRMYPPGAN